MAYGIISFFSFVIRLLLSNPFTPLGEISTGLNLAAGAAFVPISYYMVRSIYDKGSEPIIGSILFLAVYSMNTGVTYIVCRAHPTIWLMIAIVIAYFALFFSVAFFIRKSSS